MTGEGYCKVEFVSQCYVLQEPSAPHMPKSKPVINCLTMSTEFHKTKIQSRETQTIQ